MTFSPGSAGAIFWVQLHADPRHMPVRPYRPHQCGNPAARAGLLGVRLLAPRGGRRADQEPCRRHGEDTRRRPADRRGRRRLRGWRRRRRTEKAPMIVRERFMVRAGTGSPERGTLLRVGRFGRSSAPAASRGGQHASDDICSCDLGPGARSHFRRFAGNPDRPASGRSCERCRCRECHAGACVRLALPSITALASLVLPASSALKSMYEHRTCSRAGPPKAARSRRLIIERKLQASLQGLLPNVAASGRWGCVGLIPGR